MPLLETKKDADIARLIARIKRLERENADLKTHCRELGQALDRQKLANYTALNDLQFGLDSKNRHMFYYSHLAAIKKLGDVV